MFLNRYSEVIEVLYSSKIFDLAGFEVTHRFISTIAPQSLDKIRFLNLTSIQVPLFYTTAQVPERLSRNIREQNEFLNKHRLAEVKWMEICSSLGSMKSLKSLRIKIDNSALVVLEGPFLRPLMAIGVEGGSFMVEVPHNFRIGTPHTPDISGKDDKISFKIERSSPPGLVKNNQAKARPSIWKADIEGKGSGYAAECREYCSCVPQPNPYRQV
jgi:hypothetical protein